MSAGPFTIILAGAQGTGRIGIAQLMLSRPDTYGVSRIIEDWMPGDDLVSGAVHIAIDAPRVLPDGVVLYRTGSEPGRFWLAAIGGQH